MTKSTAILYKLVNHFLVLFFTLFFIEVIFNLFAFSNLISTGFIRVILLNTFYALFLTLILHIIPFKISKWIIMCIILIISIYAIVQLGFKSFMGNYMSLNQSADGIGRITDYILDFIRFLKWYYYLLLIPITLLFIYFRKVKTLSTTITPITLATLASLTLLFYGLSYMSLTLFDKKQVVKALYYHPTNIELSLKEFGITGFLNRDIVSFIVKPDENSELVIQNPTTTKQPEIEDVQNHRIVDDSAYNLLIESETNEQLANIDQFIKSKTVYDYNDQTGLFEGKNLVYIMIEAFDYMALDPVLTPTLYKMKNEGYFFSNYYTPKYSCTTGESEYIGLVSLVPEANSCAPNDFMNNSYPQSIFNLFNNKGYTTTSYHNWKDQFYERRILHANMGSSAYYNYDDIQFTLKSGWPSDLELLEKSFDIYRKNEPFMSFTVTSSSHFPYDESSWLGDKYLESINKVHPDYPIEVKRYLSKIMELDNGLKSIFDKLIAENRMQDTVFAIFADHHPLRTDFNMINDYSNTEFSRFDYNYIYMDRTPFIIYNSELVPTEFTDVMSTFDLVPTLANLFNLEFDPRLYVGVDYFSDEENIAIFTNGDWVIDQGVFSMLNDTFTPFKDNDTLSTEEIERIDTHVSNLMKSSWKIMRQDYFKYRPIKTKYVTDSKN